MKEAKAIDQQAKQILGLVEKAGVDQACIQLNHIRTFFLGTKNRDVDLLKEKDSVQLILRLFLKQRYGTFSTSDLDPARVSSFIKQSADMVKITDPDEAHGLPEKSFIGPLPRQSLTLCDEALVGSKRSEAPGVSRMMSDAAFSASSQVMHVETQFDEKHTRSVTCTTDGFWGSSERTLLGIGCSAHILDGVKKQSEWAYGCFRFWKDRLQPETMGALATERALARKGARPQSTGHYELLIHNECGNMLVNHFMRAFLGSAIYRNMSCLQDKLGKRIGSDRLTLIDDPFVPKALGSQLYDDEGMVARKRPIIEAGVLQSFYYDSYWARKHRVQPTTGSYSNLVFAQGRRNLDEMVKSMSRGILITGFIGGNFNPTTGDFSIGIRGRLVEQGKLSKPIAEMNLASNVIEFLGKLNEVGSDPYVFSHASIYTPTLRFGDVLISGAS